MELQKDIKKSLKTKVFESLGEASMCWSETPKGVFDSNNAERIGNELLEFIDNIGRTYVIDTKVLPDNFCVNEFLKSTARQVYMVNAHEAIDTREPTLQEAIKVLQKHLREDKSEGSYYHSWQANIAMAFQDEVCINPAHFADEYDFKEISNKAAKNFLNNLIKE